MSLMGIKPLFNLKHMNLQLAEENKTALERYPIMALPFVSSIKESVKDLSREMRKDINRYGVYDTSFVNTQDEYNGRSRNS